MKNIPCSLPFPFSSFWLPPPLPSLSGLLIHEPFFIQSQVASLWNRCVEFYKMLLHFKCPWEKIVLKACVKVHATHCSALLFTFVDTRSLCITMYSWQDHTLPASFQTHRPSANTYTQAAVRKLFFLKTVFKWVKWPGGVSAPRYDKSCSII